VSWLDTRAAEISHMVEDAVDAGKLYRTCGWANTNCLNMPSIIWFREKRPDLFESARFFASAADYMNHRLAGEFAIDYSNCAMTMLFDLGRRDYSGEALDAVGISRRNVPRIVRSGEVLGRLRKEVVDELGLSDETLLVSGAHDQYCAGAGAGAASVGDCVLSAGTAWVLLVTSGALLFDENRVIHPCIHVFENRYGLLASVPSGGDSLNWYRDTFRPGMGFDELSSEAEKAEEGSGGLMFIPGGVSKGTKGAFVNMDAVHSIRHFTRSVFEGVAFANRMRLESFLDNGIDISRVIMIGGGAGSSVWPRIVADVSGVEVVVHGRREAACAGAAMLAGIGAGVCSSLEEMCGRFTGGGYSVVTPRKEYAALYDAMYGEFAARLESPGT